MMANDRHLRRKVLLVVVEWEGWEGWAEWVEGCSKI